MPFREVRGSVLLGSYSAIEVETKLLPYPEVPESKCIAKRKPFGIELARVKAVGINGIIGTAPGWKSVQTQLYRMEKAPENDIVVTSGFYPVTPEVILIFCPENGYGIDNIPEIRDCYKKIMDHAEKNGINHIAIPLLGGSVHSRNNFFKQIAEDFFVSYFMMTDSEIKVDLFISDTTKIKSGLFVDFNTSQKLYIRRVCNELNDNNRMLYKIFPTLEKLGQIWYNHGHKPNENFPELISRGITAPDPEILKTYEQAAKELEKTLPPRSKPTVLKAKKSSLHEPENNNDPKPISEEAAMELIAEYFDRLDTELKNALKKGNMTKEDFYHSKLISYINDYFLAHSNCSYEKLAKKIGLKKSLIGNIMTGRSKKFSSTARSIAVASILELNGYDFYVFAVSADPKHSFPEEPEDIIAWQCAASGITDINDLEKALVDISSQFSLLNRITEREKTLSEKELEKVHKKTRSRDISR